MVYEPNSRANTFSDSRQGCTERRGTVELRTVGSDVLGKWMPGVDGIYRLHMFGHAHNIYVYTAPIVWRWLILAVSSLCE